MYLRSRLLTLSVPAVILAGSLTIAGLAAYDVDLPKKLPGLSRIYSAVVGNTALGPTARLEASFDERLDRAVQEQPAVVFLGDSLTFRWQTVGKEVWAERIAPLAAANLGVEEDRTQHLRWRARDVRMAQLQPKAAVVLIGTNNLGRNLPEEIADAVATIVADLRYAWPDADLLVLGIPPREADGLRPEDRTEANAAIERELSEQRGVQFLDLSDRFDGGPDGYVPRLFTDGLHLSAEGYTTLADGLTPVLDEILP